MAGLPNFNFSPVITPFVKAPVEALSNTTNVLNQNFDTSLDNMSKVDTALAALQAANYSGDQRLLNNLKTTFKDKLSNISNREDLENATVLTKRLLSDFSAKATPIAQRHTQITKERENIKTNPLIKDKGRALRAFDLQEELNPSFEEIDGSIINNFDPSGSSFLYTPSVNLTEKVDQLMKGTNVSVDSLDPKLRNLQIKNPTTGEMMTVANYIESGRIEELPENIVVDIIESGLAADQEVVRFREREKEFGRIAKLAEEAGIENTEVFDNYQNELDKVELYAKAKYPYTKEILDQSFNNAVNPSNNSGNPNDNIEEIIAGVSSAQNVSNVGDISNISKNIKSLKSQVNNLTGVEKDAVQDQINYLEGVEKTYMPIVKSSLDQDELDLYNQFNGYTENQLSSLNEGYITKAKEAGVRVGEIDGYNRLNKYRRLKSSMNNKINDKLKDVPDISKNYTTLNSSGSGKYSSRIGAGKDLTLGDITATGYSVVRGFSSDTGTDLASYLNKTYTDIEVDNVDGKFSYSKLETRPTDGVGINGAPLTQLTIYGKNEDGREIVIGGELVENGNVGWGKYINDAKTAIQDDNLSVRETGIKMIRRASVLPNGERVGAIVARKNLNTIENKRKLFELNDGNTLSIYKQEDGSFKILNQNKEPIEISVGENNFDLSQTFYNDEQLETLLSQISKSPL